MTARFLRALKESWIPDQVRDDGEGGDIMEEREPSYLSGEWLRTRTDKQLHEIIDGNFPKGKAFEGARAELDRREAKKDQAQQLFWIRLTFGATVVLAIAGIVATLVS